MAKEYSKRDFLKLQVGILGIGLAMLVGFSILNKYKKGLPAYFMSKTVDNIFNRFTDSHPNPSDYLDHKLIEATNIKEGDMILDAGCGDLSYLDLENKIYGIIGLDQSRFMLEEARKKDAVLLDDKNSFSKDYLQEMLKKYGYNALLIHGDARDLPFEDNSFDAAISKDVFQYISEREIAIKEMYRVVKPGKKVAITLTSIYSRFGLEKLRQTLKDSGFSDVYVSTIEKKKSGWEDTNRKKEEYRLNDVIGDILKARIPYISGTKPIQ